MIKVFKIKNIRITCGLRHRFETGDTLYRHEWHRWEISLWFRKIKIVGTNDFKNPSKWKDNLVGSYMLGFEFLFFKCWVEVNKNGMNLGI